MTKMELILALLYMANQEVVGRAVWPNKPKRGCVQHKLKPAVDFLKQLSTTTN